MGPGKEMSERITYKDAGVDIDLADRVIGSVSERIKATFRPEVIGRMGGFAAQFRPNWTRFRDPVLVSATDGVGTKLKIAFLTGIHDTVGIDLVAMNVNDILVTGAEPLFFLDYFATGAIEADTVRNVISGIARGCELAGCSLIGGETAEMPDFYGPGEYDLAGFCVGILEKEVAVDGSEVRPGHQIVGIASSGLHSNGFSLVRKVLLERRCYTVGSHLQELGKTLGEELLTPTTIYVKPILELLQEVSVLAMAHITGGGFTGNIPRVLPEDCSALIRKGAWDIQPIFRLIQREAGLDDAEMFRTFNMGVGFILVMSPDRMDAAMEKLRARGLKCALIGEIIDREKTDQRVCLAE
jgi:phosphoribosylformylglycinamidine cyclo-ligase